VAVKKVLRYGNDKAVKDLTNEVYVYPWIQHERIVRLLYAHCHDCVIERSM
jgi:hypothetical protein